jgi:hypothetical protein
VASVVSSHGRWLRFLGVVVAAVVAAGGCNAILGNDVGHLKASAQACTLNSDCSDGNLCIFATCSIPCKADVDCDNGSRCLETAKGAACVASSAAACANDQSCPEGAICSAQACRAPCETIGGTVCHGDQTCTAHVCLGADQTHDPGAADMTDGSASGGKVGSGGARASGGTAGNGGTRNSGGSAGSGGSTGAGGTTTDAGSAAGGTTTTGGATGSGGVPGSGGLTGSGGLGGTGGSGPVVKTLTTTALDIQPGQEQFECQNFTNPYGTDMAVVETDSTMPGIAHQTLAFYGTSFSAAPLAACSGVGSGPFIHDAQTPADALRYPADVGRRLLATEGLRIWTHYINTTSSIVSAQTTITLHAVPLASVHKLADGMWLYNTAINLPPQQTSTVSRTYTTTYDINLLRAVGLMYKHGTRMKGSAGTQVLYDQPNWSGPTPALFPTPLVVPTGTALTWSCTYQNTMPTVITFGSAVSTNERCEMYGVFYATLSANQGTFIVNSGN